jgi:hypothetical protein
MASTAATSKAQIVDLMPASSLHRGFAGDSISPSRAAAWRNNHDADFPIAQKKNASRLLDWRFG